MTWTLSRLLGARLGGGADTSWTVRAAAEVFAFPVLCAGPVSFSLCKRAQLVLVSFVDLVTYIFFFLFTELDS